MAEFDRQPMGANNETTDMVETARETQQQDIEREQSRTDTDILRIIAPAKVNLFLDIGKRQPDGYHEAISIMHALTMHDTLLMRCDATPEAADQRTETQHDATLEAAGLQVEISCKACGGIAPLTIPTEQNIVSQAVRALAQRIGRSEDETMQVYIEKSIPAEAGLGGGSSDAAAALVGAAQLWDLAPDDPRIEQTARDLGADVAFFLHGGCVCLTGVGDVFSHALEPMKSYVALVKPQGGVTTADAYRAFDEHPTSICDADRQRALEAQRACDVPLCNNLTDVSEQLLPTLVEIRTWIEGHDGVQGVLMSGSGSAIFAICDSFAAASAIAAGAQTYGWWSRTTSFGSVRAAVVPQS